MTDPQTTLFSTPINQVTLDNLKRKSAWVDQVQMVQGVPLLSFIDLNVTELCNRKCVFCPRSGDYPNQDLNMGLPLVEKLAKELQELDFKGIVNICGYGEPLLHKQIVQIVHLLASHGVHTEMITNGDKLTQSVARDLQAAGLLKLIVSMYDGPHQIEKFTEILAPLGQDFFVLRDRWHTEEKGYGLILTNRAGVLQTGTKENPQLTSPCYYTHYSMALDWNGDALLCVQDWHKKVKMGNLYAQHILEIWKSKLFNKYRRALGQGNRKAVSPCDQCDARGVLHGKNHQEAWAAITSPS